MISVIEPFAGYRSPFSGGNRCNVTDNSHKVTMPPRLNAQDTEAILCIMECDALDNPREHLAFWPERRLSGVRHRLNSFSGR
jgi:hypothetical protein